MNRTLSLALLGWTLAAYGAAAAPLRVVTTTEDFAAIAREIGGARVQAEALFKGFQDPHQLGSFLNEHPNRRLSLERADLFIAVGPTLEGTSAYDPFVHLVNGKVRPGAPGYLDASVGCRIVGMPAVPGSRASGTVHTLGSPHYWLDPENGAVIARTISEKLSTLDPEGRAEYQASLERFLSSLKARQAKWAADASRVRGFPVLTYRDSWGNLAAWLGLRVLGTLEERPGMAPSKRRLDEMNRLIRAEGVAAVLIEPYFPRKDAERAVDGTSAKVLVLAPSVGATEDIRSYFDLFDRNLAALAAAAKSAGYQPKDDRGAHHGTP